MIVLAVGAAFVAGLFAGMRLAAWHRWHCERDRSRDAATLARQQLAQQRLAGLA